MNYCSWCNLLANKLYIFKSKEMTGDKYSIYNICKLCLGDATTSHINELDKRVDILEHKLCELISHLHRKEYDNFYSKMIKQVQASDLRISKDKNGKKIGKFWSGDKKSGKYWSGERK